jgi:hypothetical protein
MYVCVLLPTIVIIVNIIKGKCPLLFWINAVIVLSLTFPGIFITLYNSLFNEAPQSSQSLLTMSAIALIFPGPCETTH